MGMSEPFIVLVVNPGSTSTKIAVSTDGVITEKETFQHDAALLKSYDSVWGQFDDRLDLCRKWATERLSKCSAVVSLGGLIKPVQGGTYRVGDNMLNDAKKNIQGEHASNLGCALALHLAKEYACPAFIVDPVSVDEFEPLAYYSGHPLIRRRSLSHALSIHAAAYRAAKALHRPIASTAFIICHLGGGISVAPVRAGKIIDVNDAASDGPFSPERTGGLPLQPLVRLSFSGKYSEEEIHRMIMGTGGLVAYLGTNSVLEIERRILQDDGQAEEVLRAMAYQISKEIGAMAAVLSGSVDAVVLTGGIANSTMLTSWIEERVRFIAPVLIQTGNDEMQALVDGALRVLRGEEQAKEYTDG
jgi:butyrate kinase